jgi:hypothetical protein
LNIPSFMATGIGSMPFDDPQHAVELSLSRLPEAPFWPQLPRTGLNERMEIQYSEGMPCLIMDSEKNRIFFDTSGDYSEAFAQFYEKYLASVEAGGDLSCMAVSEAFSKGIYALERRLASATKKLPFVKVQTIGPCSFALTVTDQDKRAIYYNEEFRDMIVKALTMKCRWQIKKFQPYAEKVICFIDEPILAGFGSSTYVSVKRQDVVNHLAEMIEAIHNDHALAGVHCCGNTEWSILMDAGVDIVSFDAFGFGETIAMYPEAVKKHLDRGGWLAWGVVPTSKAIREQNVPNLVLHFEKKMDHLASKGVDKHLISERAMITPSCGTGSLLPEDAEKVFETLDDLSKTMRAKYAL